jgi:trans-aconitate 2-methyltransferase
MSDWDPELYNRFRRYRAEPVEAILQRRDLRPDERIVDLGCGSGENTVELARRTAQGFALGIDSSPAMIERANRLRDGLESSLAARVRFELGDIAQFTAREEYTLVFSNAALQWVSDRRSVLEACYRALVPGGRLVVQMPANHEETSQVTLNQLAEEEPWRSILGRAVATPSHTVEAPEHYRRFLGELGFFDVDCYYQTFNHPMGSPAEIVEWSRATTLRPFLDALPDEHHVGFIACWRIRMEQAYGTTGPLIFPFRRIFIWARRPAKQDGA